MNPALLVADVGNTRIKFAFLTKGHVQDSLSVLPAWLRSCIAPQAEPFEWHPLRELREQLDVDVTTCLMAGSQRETLEHLEATWPTDFPAPRIIRSATELPIELAVDHPDKVGVDRVLNAVAVNFLRSDQAPAIIVDCGTAITIDAVSPAGQFLGGAILPGFELASHALHDYTSLLPMIPMQEIIGEFPPVIGRNTRNALRSGLIWGQVGAVNEIVLRMSASLQSESVLQPQYFLTGGAAPLLEPHLRQHFRTYPHLTLQGLGCLAE